MRLALFCLFACLLTVVSACSKSDLEKMKKTASKALEKVGDSLGKAKDKVGNEVEKAKQGLNLAGTMELKIAETLEIKGCYAELLVFPSGRGNVLQVTSYPKPAQEAFPSVFFRARVDAGSFQELAGKTVSGELFIQRVEDGPTLHSEAGDPIKVRINSADSDSLNAHLIGGTINDPETNSTSAIAGSFDAVKK